MTTPLLEVQDVHHQFAALPNQAPLPILKGVNLSLFPGETLAICGRSGEGKTSLLHILGGLITPTQGHVAIQSIPLSEKNGEWMRRKKMGFLFQAFHLLEEETIWQNVLMPARIDRRSTGKKSAVFLRMEEILDEIGLKPRAHFPTKYLSGGEKQRVALARALCNDPPLLLADEPSGNLDSASAAIVHELLFRFARQPGRGLIVVTHDRELAKLCDRRYLLKDGMLLPADF